MSDYVIQKGDTLSKIAKLYGTSVKQLLKDNDIKNPNFIFAGKTLKINNTQGDIKELMGFVNNNLKKETEIKDDGTVYERFYDNTEKHNGSGSPDDATDYPVKMVIKDKNGNIKETIEYEYKNENNFLSKMTTKDADGKVVQSQEYFINEKGDLVPKKDTNENLTKEIETKDDGTVYERFYDNTKKHNGSGSPDDATDYPVKMVIKDKNGNIKKTIEYEYKNENNFLSKMTTKDADGNIVYSQEYIIDKNGHLMLKENL